MIEKKIIITGGTDGIGLALTKRLIKDKFRIFIVGKNEHKGNKVLKELNYEKVEFLQCDLTEKKQIQVLCEKLNKLKNIDCLVNNAGAIFDKREVNGLGVEKTFALNHLSYFQLSLSLLEKLEMSHNPKIINVSSGAHKRYGIDISDLENKNNYNSWRAYCQSKLLNIFITYSFNRKTKSKILCNCFHPGFVNSNFGNNNSSILRFSINIAKKIFAITNDEATKTPYYLINSEYQSNTTGKYFYKKKIKKTSNISYDKSIADIIWEKSLEYIK